MKNTRLMEEAVPKPSTASTEQLDGQRVDRFGAVASSLCAVHCAVCALLPSAFGALGLGFLFGHEAEWMFTLIAVIFAGGALVIGGGIHAWQCGECDGDLW